MLLSRLARYGCAQVKVPSVDITNYLNQKGNWQVDCRHLAQNFQKYGLIVIKDPRVNASHNNRFLDLMENYFKVRSRQFDEGNTTIDVANWSGSPVGIMHSMQEKFASYQQEKQKLKDPHRSLTPTKPGRDPKWRFQWHLGYDKNVVPQDFPQWSCVMDEWASNMKNGCLTVSEMLAVGLGMEKDFLSKTIVNGTFHLAPTAVDLEKAKKGDVLAAFHRDFSLVTIHGKSRFPGLFAWLNTGERFQVSVPDGHLLVQAGKQLQWYTGGHIKAGFHEVVYSQQTEQARLRAQEQGRPLWRISSTMFCQVQQSLIMEPHPSYKTLQASQQYPPISAYDYLASEIYCLTGKE